MRDDQDFTNLCVSANLEKFQKPATRVWLEGVLARQPAMIFGQELHKPELLRDLAEEHGYILFNPPKMNERWWIGSWVLVRQDLSSRPASHELLEVFDSYVACAEVELPTVGTVTAFSVHASTKEVTDDVVRRWPRPLPAERRRQRARVDRNPGYADLMLEVMKDAALQHPVIAAGDFNVSRLWDVNDNSDLCQQFFDAVSGAGFTDVTYEEWGEERRTYFRDGHPPYQNDHLFVSNAIRSRVARAWVDEDWADADQRTAHADHAPLWFELDLER